MRESGVGRIPTLPALDGIRALAIAAVLTYHGDVFWTPGGLLGVEVFFVLSGYLITSLLWSELRESQRIGIGTFLKRRARRLLPAVFVMIAVVAAAFVVWWPDEVGRMRGDVAAAATYTSNWYLIGTDHSYFATFARPSPFGHLWSLAIEEQFYLVWPPVLFLLWRVLRRRPAYVAAAACVGAVASVIALMLLFSGDDPSRIYYGTDTRAAGLLIGAALAMLWRPYTYAPVDRKNVKPMTLDAITVASVGFLVFAFMRFDDLASTTYRPGLLVVALATAALIATAVHPEARVARFFGTSPLRWLGKRSYSVYIWYFPVFAVTRPGVDYDVTIGTAFAIRLAATITLAELSYRFVEQPIRNGALGRLARNLRDRARVPALAGRRVALRMAAGGVIVTVLLTGLAIEIIRAPLIPITTESNSAPVAQLDPIEEIHFFPSTTVVSDRPVIAIGDSVMSGARQALRDTFSRISVDARVARQVPEGIARLEAYRDAGRLGRVVIIHLGNNGRFTTPQFERIMRVLANVERVLFVNVKVPRRWEASVNHVLSDGVRRHPGHAVLVSWRRLARSCPGRVFGPDGTHVTDNGARCYAKIIAASASPP